MKKKLYKLAADFRKSLFGKTDPTGFCYAASCGLISFLSKKGIKAKLIKGSFSIPKFKSLHYWVVCENFNIDITGDQFNQNIFFNGSKIPKIPKILVTNKLPVGYRREVKR